MRYAAWRRRTRLAEEIPHLPTRCLPRHELFPAIRDAANIGSVWIPRQKDGEEDREGCVQDVCGDAPHGIFEEEAARLVIGEDESGTFMVACTGHTICSCIPCCKFYPMIGRNAIEYVMVHPTIFLLGILCTNFQLGVVFFIDSSMTKILYLCTRDKRERREEFPTGHENRLRGSQRPGRILSIVDLRRVLIQEGISRYGVFCQDQLDIVAPGTDCLEHFRHKVYIVSVGINHTYQIPRNTSQVLFIYLMLARLA
ncbi:uncharacterized protein LOC124668528 [Lolium rigidum]|uniref:uncharacterized protein LOC124668528 n=1 Tax=Lolium rigidum TaxID=89674 RepID=UPI001F5CC3F2|nr:uncharacterized protein LOC124668528 [Lolium rigidum]